MRLFALVTGLLLVHAAAAAPTDGYVACAKEGEQCAVATPGNVIYGAASSYTAPKHIDLPGILCSNANFTDPINGTAKTCWFRADASPPIVAQVDVCTGLPIPAGAVVPQWGDFGSLNAPTCKPIKSDTSTGPFEHHNSVGIVGYSYCKVDGKWKVQLGAATWDFLIGKNLAANAKAALASDTPLTTFQQLTIATVTTPLSDPTLTPVWCPALASIRANKPADDAPPPPPPGPTVWRALGTSIYTAAAGKLVAPIAGARAAAAALCDATATPIVAGAVTYLPLVGAPATQVTSCKKASQ